MSHVKQRDSVAGMRRTDPRLDQDTLWKREIDPLREQYGDGLVLTLLTVAAQHRAGMEIDAWGKQPVAIAADVDLARYVLKVFDAQRSPAPTYSETDPADRGSKL